MIELVTEEHAKNMASIWPSAISADFSGKPGQAVVHYTTEHESSQPADGESIDIAPETHVLPRRFLWVGIGKRSALDSAGIRNATAAAVDRVNSLRLNEAVLCVDPTDFAEVDISVEDLLEEIATAAVSANYTFSKYKTAKPDDPDSLPSILKDFAITLKSPNGKLPHVQLPYYQQAIEKANILGAATNYSRNLVNERADVCTPQFIEQEARQLVNSFPELFELEVLDAASLKENGLNLMAAVGQGT